MTAGGTGGELLVLVKVKSCPSGDAGEILLNEVFCPDAVDGAPEVPGTAETLSTGTAEGAARSKSKRSKGFALEAGGAFPFEESSSEDWLPLSLDGGTCCIFGVAPALDGSESILKSIKLSITLGGEIFCKV